MSVTTPNLGLIKATGSDKDGTYLKNSLAASLDILDAALTLTGTQTLTNKTLTSPHMTTPVVDSGGLTVTLGGVNVTAGNVGIGAAPIASQELLVAGTGVLSGSTTQYGINANPTGGSGGTGELSGVSSTPATSAAAYVCTTVTAFHAANPIKGAGSTITSAYGLLVDAITTGNTNNYGIDVSTPSGGATTNIGIRVAGGNPAIYITAGGLTVAAGTTTLAGNLALTGTALGFYGTSPQGKGAVVGSRGGNAALANLLTTLAGYGLITDSTTA